MHTRADHLRIFVEKKVSKFMPKFVSVLVTQCAGPCRNAKPKARIDEAREAESRAE